MHGRHHSSAALPVHALIRFNYIQLPIANYSQPRIPHAGRSERSTQRSISERLLITIPGTIAWAPHGRL